MTVVRLTVADPCFAGATELFDEYRQHYGANPAPEAWLRDQILGGRTHGSAGFETVSDVTLPDRVL